MRTRTLVLGIVLGVGSLCLVAIVACAGFFFFAFRNMDATVSPKIDALFSAIDNGTFGEMYATETAPECRKASTQKEWEQLGSAIKARLGRFRAKNLVQFSIHQFNADQCADVVYSATFEKGSGEIRARFRRINGEWRIVTFRVNSPEFLKDLDTTACPHCGSACPVSAKFCPTCGGPMGGRGKIKPVPTNDGRRDQFDANRSGRGDR